MEEQDKVAEAEGFASVLEELAANPGYALPQFAPLRTGSWATSHHAKAAAAVDEFPDDLGLGEMPPPAQAEQEQKGGVFDALVGAGAAMFESFFSGDSSKDDDAASSTPTAGGPAAPASAQPAAKKPSILESLTDATASAFQAFFGDTEEQEPDAPVAAVPNDPHRSTEQRQRKLEMDAERVERFNTMNADADSTAPDTATTETAKTTTKALDQQQQSNQGGSGAALGQSSAQGPIKVEVTNCVSVKQVEDGGVSSNSLVGPGGFGI
jgi:hypothetical protein